MKFEINQGGLTVVQTGSVLVYDNMTTLTIDGDYKIEIKYEDGSKDDPQDIKISPTDNGVELTLRNFNNPLGTASSVPIPIAKRGEITIHIALAVYKLGVAKMLYFNICEGK